MIDQYFLKIEEEIRKHPNIRTYSIRKKVYNLRQGFISGVIIFENGDILDFTEVKNTRRFNKLKYRYQYMDAKRKMVFRYDNANHHPDKATFPHHKHTTEGTVESKEPNLADILFEITASQKTIRK